MRRAWAAWRGEHVVWLLPGLKKPQRWIEVPARLGLPDNTTRWMLAVPGEPTECVRVYHVTDTGVVRGPGATDCFPGLAINGLVNAWPNQQTCEVFWPLPSIVRQVSTIREHEKGIGVTYVEKPFAT